ncbi:MAG: ACT domain-containing protein [Deltaproteobacteria bacterium]|nr:ACT domain-containing protein [Deltaproteobacteria bacterium]
MAYSIRKVDVWAAEIEDRPGGLAEKLEALARAGASLEFIISRRAPDKPGKGVVFLTPVRGAKQTRAAIDAGLGTTDSLHSLRVEGPDRPGLGTKMTRALADAGINLRGLSAAALGRKSVSYFAFDSADDAANAIKLLRKALK